MTNEFIFSHVDHTLLKAAATWEEISKLCEEAEKYHMASVCIPSSFVKKVREEFPSLTICTVVGFPWETVPPMPRWRKRVMPLQTEPMKSTWSSISVP